MKKITIALLAGTLLLAACSDADVASHNLSKAADNFEVYRRIVFYDSVNGYGGEGAYLLVIEGLCSLGNYDESDELSITCKVGPDQYKKHFLGLNSNITYFVEQLEPKTVSRYFYRVIFKPSVILPDPTG